MKRNLRRYKNQSGVALLMVLFIVSLATSLVVGLTYSTFLQSRSIGLVERQLQAEYLLKSLVEFAAGVVNADADTRLDSFHDVWGMFREGNSIPPELLEALGINFPGIEIALEITPEN
ncbi:MAG: hypothetical protein KDD62_04730, partial [Bdellovibrionales bacterium]|nr:hypothetical protein [Bdellovibrionales bacterium]